MWWESDLAHREMLCCRAFSWRTASADPLSGSEIAWGCLWVRLGCARGQNKIAFNRDSRVFAVFSAPLRPSPDPRTPPDLSRPLRGPYEPPRPNPRVQANDGANPYGGWRGPV